MSWHANGHLKRKEVHILAVINTRNFLQYIRQKFHFYLQVAGMKCIEKERLLILCIRREPVQDGEAWCG